MAQNKTSFNNADVYAFIQSFVSQPQKIEDSYKLIDLMQQWSGFEPKMFGPTIIGFGTYRYRYASGHSGEAPLIAFSPRKAEFSLYVIDPEEDNTVLLSQLGKYKIGKSCIYFKKLEDLNLHTLEKICRLSIRVTLEKYNHLMP
jgi:hypothetical protein